MPHNGISNLLVRMRPLQRLDTPPHDPLPQTQHLDFHLLDPLQLPHRADVGLRARLWPKLARPRDLEASVRVLSARVGAGTGGEEGAFACFEGGGGDVEGEGEACECRAGHRFALLRWRWRG